MVGYLERRETKVTQGNQAQEDLKEIRDLMVHLAQQDNRVHLDPRVSKDIADQRETKEIRVLQGSQVLRDLQVHRALQFL